MESETAIHSVRERLEGGGYRLTPQRQAVLEVFLLNPERHLSADDVYGLVKTGNPEIGLATVYRTLELFREQRVLHEHNFGQGMSRYEYAGVEHHHHLVCLKCGKVFEFSSEALEKLERQLSQAHDFEVVGHHLRFFGYCRECRSKV